MTKSVLDDAEKFKTIDKSNMIDFCLDAPKHYAEAAKLSGKVKLDYSKPDNIIVSGMGGSAIGGDLLRDWARDQTKVPIEVNRDYQLPTYADKRSLVLITSYSGDTEESLSSFLDALKRKCMIYCVSSGGALLDNAERLKVPYLKVPSGMPPRAALPYLFVPLLCCIERMGLVLHVSKELSEALKVLEKVSQDNSPSKPVTENFSKSLASKIGQKTPVIYGFDFYRSVAMRFKQQFNENTKIPAKWEVFSELNHNEIVGWEQAGKLAKWFSAIIIRDNEEPTAIHSRIEISKEIMKQAGVDLSEVHAQGKTKLAKMLSTICTGDFTSLYLAFLHGVDPTPVKTINYLKETLKQNGVQQQIIKELEKLGKT